jgi:predicted Zn-dependent peptidase
MAHEPADRLGLAGVVEDSISKGTAVRSARELSDAFDMLGAQRGSGVGRESMVFRCSCLPEFASEALSLHAEMLRTPVFPSEACEVAVGLAQQRLTALEDDPGELANRLLAPRAYGAVLGRHELGTRETLGRLKRDDVVAYWRRHFGAGRMQVSIGGAVDLPRFEALLESLFEGYAAESSATPDGHELLFVPGREHHTKKLEQQQILVCWPGVALRDADYPIEHLIVAMLGDGMSSRLFTEVREKLGLVYWVAAWDEHPRAGGRIFLGASTTPARCGQTIGTLMREVERLNEDVTEEELARAKVGIIARAKTHGEITRARVSELASDLFHHGRPVPMEEKNAKIEAVRLADIHRYLAEHPREPVCLVTLGPQDLMEAAG